MAREIIKWVLFAAIALLATGCGDSMTESVLDFDNVKQLGDGELLFADDDCILGYVTTVDCWEGYILLQSRGGTDAFHLLDSTNAVVCSFGKKGHSSEECLDYGLNCQIQDSCVSFYDWESKQSCRINLSWVLSGASPLNISRRTVTYIRDFRPSRIANVRNRIVCMGAFREGRFGLVDENDSIVHHGIDYPFPTGEMSWLEKGPALQGFILANDFQGKCVLTTLASDVFEIIDVCSGESPVRTFVSQYRHAPVIVKHAGRYTTDSDKSIAGFVDGYATDEKVYLLYRDGSYKDMLNGNHRESMILSFDWEGNKQVKYLLPFDIECFAVNGDRLYAVADSSGTNRLYMFEL